MVSCNCTERHFDYFVSVEGNFAHQMIEPPSIEDCFDFAEDCLDWIELRAIAHIPDWYYVELREIWLCIHCLVDLQLIHEECKRTLPVLLPELLQELNELFGCESLRVNSVRAYTLFLGHRSYDCLISRVNAFLIDSEVGVGP